MGSLNLDINKVVLENAPLNAKYTSPTIQKEILCIFAKKVRKIIREEVGESKFTILVDEAKDESNSEQMAIILRFVDVNGFLRERFLDIVHVSDTTSATLKKEISNVLSHHNLLIQNMRGQGYDGASNMRGAWNGLQALFLKECPYAYYYIHCFAHRLQLALVAAAEDEFCVWQFFSNLTSIVNLVSASSKRHGELQSAQAIEITRMLATGERVSGRGANQIGNLRRSGATRWSSHFDSICSLVDMYDATCTVLQSLIDERQTRSICGEAAGALMGMKSFDFIFILNLMHRIMGLTDLLCKALQHKYVDILGAMNFVSTTKALLQTMRQSGWETLITYVESFCRSHDIDIPDMGAVFKGVRSRKKAIDVTFEHHYHIDIFNAVIDHQLMELNSRFSEGAMEILILSSALEPKDGFRSFNIDDICKLAEKFYPGDFTKQDIFSLRCQLQHYEGDIICHSKFQNMSTISELCRGLVEEKRSEHYYLIDRLLRLILTLPVSTATTERSFSAMKLVKTDLRNKMGDDYLRDSMDLYIEKELAETIDADSIVDYFCSLKKRRVTLQ